MDYSRLDAIAGALMLSAESLDLTTLYDSYTNQEAAPGASTLPEQGAPGGPQVGNTAKDLG